MICQRCTSDSRRSFNSEIAIHFPGLNGLDKPIVWVFPRLAVCLACGSAEFIVPERELRVLVQGIPVGSAVVFPKNAARPSEDRAKSPSPGTDG
jgi:hypothetical protein